MSGIYRIFHVFLLLVIAILLASCGTTLPAPSQPPLTAEIPATWLAKSLPTRGEQSQVWWTEFKDSALNSAIYEALQNNHDLNAAAARIETARAEARIAGANLYPQMQGGLNAARSKQIIEPGSGGVPGTVTGVGPTSIISESFGVSLDVSWELDIWGRISSGAAAAMGDLQAQEADYAAAALSLAAQTAKAWFAMTEARLQLDLADETVESYRKTARQAANRVDAGVQSPTDKHLTEANLASAEALAQQRREILKRASRQLESLLGRYPAGDIATSRGLPAVPPMPPRGIPSELLSRRPDLVAVERRLAALNSRVDAAQAELLPRISLTGSTGTSSREINNLLDGDFLGWSIAGNLVQPIFQGGRLRAQVAATQSRSKEAAESYAQQALIAFGEVEIALAVDEHLRLHEAAQQRTAKSAGEAARIAQNRYGQGIETLLSVLEGQRRQLDALSAVISAHRQRLENRVDLYLALGGGFEGLIEQNSDKTL